MTTEVWRPHPEFADHEVSNLGRVRRYLKPFLMSNGYPHVSLGGVKKRRYLHQLVLEAFVGERPKGLVIRHLDGNKENNELANLVYGTRLENGADTVRHGRSNRGERHALSKLKDAQAADIKKRLESGEVRSALAKEYGVSYATIKLIHKGRRWAHIESTSAE